MNPSSQAIRAELERRGALKPNADIPGVSPSGREERIKALRDELQRRAAIESAPSLWDRVKQFGSGIASGAHGWGVAMGLSDPFMNINPQYLTFKKKLQDEERARQQAKAEALKNMDASGRILHEAGEWIGVGAPIPGGQINAGVKMLPFFARFAGKQMLKDAATGAASGALQEGGMNPLGAALVAGLGVSGAIGTGRGVKQGSQYLFAPREQKTARTLNKIYTRKAGDMGETRPVHEAFNVPAALEELNPITTPTEAGTGLRETLAHELKMRKDARETKTKPLYKAVEENASELPTPETHTLIDDLLRSNRGDTRKAVQDVQKELSFSHNRLTPAERKNKEFVERYLQDNPNVATSPALMTEIKKTYPYRDMTPTAHEVDKIIRQVIDPKLKTADESLKKELVAIKESLLKETSSVPQLKEARETFAEMSKPVNKIERHPLLKLAVKKDDFNKSYTFGESDLPQKVIDPSLQSIHHAQDLLNEIKGHKNTLDATKGYIHRHIIEQITDGYGKVSHEKLQGWKRKNPGAFVIDPSLETKLKNLSNSQYLVNQARLKINNASLKDTFSHFGLKTGAKFLPSFVGKEKLMELLSFKLADDIQGKDELIMKLIQSPQFKQLLETKPKQTGKIEKLARVLAPAMRNISIATLKNQGRQEQEPAL